MAHLYGTLEGNRGMVSRLGTKKSGLTTVAASWGGAVQVDLWHDKDNNVDMADVFLIPWEGKGRWRQLYRGPVSGTKLVIGG